MEYLLRTNEPFRLTERSNGTFYIYKNDILIRGFTNKQEAHKEYLELISEEYFSENKAEEKALNFLESEMLRLTDFLVNRGVSISDAAINAAIRYIMKLENDIATENEIKWSYERSKQIESNLELSEEQWWDSACAKMSEEIDKSILDAVCEECNQIEEAMSTEEYYTKIENKILEDILKDEDFVGYKNEPSENHTWTELGCATKPLNVRSFVDGKEIDNNQKIINSLERDDLGYEKPETIHPRRKKHD